MTGEHTASKKEMAPHGPAINYCLKVKYPLRFVVSYVQPATQHYESRKHLCNQSSHYEKYGRFLLRREAITCHHQIDTIRCQQR